MRPEVRGVLRTMNLFEGEHPEMGRVALWGGGLLLVTWLPLCAAGDASGVGSGAEPTLTQLQGFIGEAACKTNEDCRTIAIGAKACGGPDAYLAWSARQTDAKALAAAAKRYAELRRSQHEQAGRMSNCAFVSDPGAQCETASRGDAEAPNPAAAASGARVVRLRCVLNQGQGGAARPAY